MNDPAKLDHLLECLHQLNWLDQNLTSSSGGVYDRLKLVREQVCEEILDIVRSSTGSDIGSA